MAYIPRHLRPPPPPPINYKQSRLYDAEYSVEGVKLHASIKAQSAEAVKARLMRHLGTVEIINISVAK